MGGKMTKRSYEFCPLRKQGLPGLDGIEDQAFRCEERWTFPGGEICKKCYEVCEYAGNDFKKCSFFIRNQIRNQPREDSGSSSSYYGCDAGAIG
jgi:hypothetical protein